MSLLRRAFRAGPPPRTGNYSSGGDVGAGAAGLVVDAGGRGGSPTAVSTALSIIWFLARRLGAMPRVICEADDRTRQPVRDPRHRMLWGAPRPGLSAVAWWVQAFAHLEGWAEIFIWKRLVGGDVVGLDLIHPSRVDVVHDRRGDPVYFLDGDRSTRFTRSEIVHVMGPSWDGIRGVPPVQAGLGAHQVAALQERWQRNFLRRGAAPSGVMTSPSELDDEAVDEFYELWEQQFGGSNNVGGVLLVQGGAEYKPMTISPVDMQLLQAKQYSREEILGHYAPGVPHHLLGWKSNTSNFGTGLSQQGVHLVQHVFLPRMQLVSSALTEALLPPELVLWWDTSLWLDGDQKTQAEVWTKMRIHGAATREEWRRAVRMPALDLPDDLLLPKNSVAVEVATGKTLHDGTPGRAARRPAADE